MSNPQAIRAVQRQAWFIVFAGIAISSTSHAQDLLRDEQVGRLLESNLALDGAKLRRPAFTELTLFPNWSQVALFRNTQPSYIRRGDLMPTIPGFANPKSGTESGPLVDVVADLVVHEYMADLDGDGKPEIVQEYHSSNIEWQDLLTFVGSVSSAGGDEQVLWSSALSWGGSYPVGFAVETLLRSITTTTGAIATLGISLGWEGPEFIDAITNGGPTERTLPIPLSLIFSGGHLLEAADVAIQPGLPFVFDVTISSSDDVLLDQHDVVVNDLLVAGALTGRSDLVVRGNLDVRGFYTNAGGTVKGDFTVFSGGRVSSLSGTVEGNLLNSGEIFNATGTVVGSLVQASGATLETGNLTVLGGFLANPGELIVRGSLNTNAGLFSNSGTMRILGGSFTNTDVVANGGQIEWESGTFRQDWINNATLNILDVTGSRYLDQTARLVNNATVNQAGLLSFDRTSADRDLVVNNSLWVLDGDSADVLYSGTSGTSGTVDTGTFVNAGTLRKIGGGRSDINVGFTNRNGTVDVFEGTLSVQQHDGLVNGTLVGGAWTVRDGGVLTLNGGSISTNAAHVTLHGPTAQFDGLDGLVVNTGSLTLLDGHEFDTAESLYNFGTIETRTRSRMYVHGDFILQASATTTIEFDHRMISNIDGVALIADGGSDRSSSAHLGGLSMAGSLSGLGDGTTFSPQGLRAAIEIDGFAQLSGTLDLRLEDLSLGNPGVEFTILSFAGYSGSFDEILFPLLGPGTAWWWEARTTSFVVGLETMAPLSVPTPAGFLLIGAGILLRSRRRHTPRQTAA